MSQNFSGTRNIILFLAVATTLIVSVFLSLNSEKNKKKMIHIGVPQWPGFEYLFIAKKQGFFEQVGLDIELVELSSLTEVRRAFERGKIDGMAATLVEVLEAYKYSSKIAKPVLVIDYSNGAYEILTTGNIKNIKDLKGKVIGVEAGSMSSYIVHTALKLHNVKHSEVVLMPMSLHALPKALGSGKVDAITKYAPTSITIKKQHDVNVIFDSSEIPHKLLDIIAINDELLTDNKLLQNKLFLAWQLTLEYIDNHPENSYQILTERMHVSENEFSDSMKLINLVSDTEQTNYFNSNGIIHNNLENMGEIIFMHSNNNIDYSKFMLDNTIN